MEREIIKARLNPVDVLIHPRVEIYTAMDFQHAADFIRLGEIKHKVFAGQIEGI